MGRCFAFLESREIGPLEVWEQRELTLRASGAVGCDLDWRLLSPREKFHLARARNGETGSWLWNLLLTRTRGYWTSGVFGYGKELVCCTALVRATLEASLHADRAMDEGYHPEAIRQTVAAMVTGS